MGIRKPGNTQGPAQGPVSPGASRAQEANPPAKAETAQELDPIDALQLVLDLAGMVPGMGVVASSRMLGSISCIFRSSFQAIFLAPASRKKTSRIWLTRAKNSGLGPWVARSLSSSPFKVGALPVGPPGAPGCAGRFHRHPPCPQRCQRPEVRAGAVGRVGAWPLRCLGCVFRPLPFRQGVGIYPSRTGPRASAARLRLSSRLARHAMGVVFGHRGLAHEAKAHEAASLGLP